MNNILKNLKAQKVTLYFLGGFGYSKIEASSWAVLVETYAQYAAAVSFTFIGKGQRNARGSVQTFQPSLVILEGWGHIDPAEKFDAPVTSGDVTTRRGRFSACSTEWTTEFDAALSTYVEKTGAVVLADYRGHDPHGSVDRMVGCAVGCAA